MLMVQFQLLSKLTMHLKNIQVEFSVQILVKISLMMLTMQSQLLDMEMLMEKITGSLKTLGEQLGEKKDSSELREV